MFIKFRLFKKIKLIFNSNNLDKFDKIRNILSSYDTNLNVLIYIKNKLQSFKVKNEELKEFKLLLEDLEFNIRQKLDKIEFKDNLERKLYDFDEIFERSDNTDFGWYISCISSEMSKINLKSIENMYLIVNKTFSLNLIFSSKKYLEKTNGRGDLNFFELDYETKIVILKYGQIIITTSVQEVLNAVKIHYQDLYDSYFPEGIVVKLINDEKLDSLLTLDLNKIRKLLDAVIDISKEEIKNLREEFELVENDIERKKIENKLSRVHHAFNVKVNVINHAFNALDSYYKHFLKESRWRVIDVYSHVKNGKIYYFGEPANGVWMWAITKDNDFNIGNRSEAFKGGYYEKLPHSTISMGKFVKGAGEVKLVDGKIIEFNSQTGHFYDITDPEQFDENCKNIFLLFSKNLELDGPKKFVRYPLSE